MYHHIGCGSCVECRCVTVHAMQRSAGGVHNILKLPMLHFEQFVLHCTDKLQCMHFVYAWVHVLLACVTLY